jgi:GIY-YIG catalytic domain
MEIFIYTLSDPITNQILYCGKTLNLKERLRKHLNEKYNFKKRNWILNLKEMNLKPKMEILEICDYSNWEIMEKYWISQLKCWGFNLYNISEGGENGSVGYRHTLEARQKISEKQKDRKLSEKWKENISNGKKGVKFSETHIENLILARNNRIDDIPGKPIYKICMETGKILKKYDKICHAAKELNVEQSNISVVCSGKTKFAYGFYWCFIENYEKFKFEKYQRKDQRNLLKVDFNGNILNEYISVHDASIKNKISRHGISHCINKDCFSYKGHIWVLNNDNKYDRIKKCMDNVTKKYKLEQFDKNNVINTFNSIKEATEQTKIKHISCVCNGKRKSAGGYIWRKIWE